MSAVTVVRQAPKQKRARRRQQRQPRQKKAGKTTVIRVAAQPKQQRRRKRGSRNGIRGNRTARTASGIGATSFSRTKARTITVSNEEFIGAVTVANQPAFNVTSYSINPGNSTTFPWLSLQARQWEKYVFQNLEFYYKREVSEFATAGSAGKLIMSVDFDASDAAPSTKQQMEDSIPHADSMPCENVTLRLPISQMHGPSVISKYVRTGGLPGSADIKTYDVGRLHVATQGVPSNTEIGELRVRYTCVFSVPVLDSTNVAPVNNAVSVFRQSGDASGATTVDYTLALATADFNGLSIVNTAGSFVPPAGNYLVDGNIEYLNTTNNMDEFQFQMKKNGTLVGYVSFCSPAADNSRHNQALPPHFITCNGTDAFTFVANVTYASGTCTTSAQVRFVAV